MRIQDIMGALGKASSSSRLIDLPLSPVPLARTRGHKEAFSAWCSHTRAQSAQIQLQPGAGPPVCQFSDCEIH